jgi:MoxR-like ATPase
MKEAKEVSAEMMFLDGINYPVEITAKVPKETTVASAAPAAKDYSKLLKDFEANDADEINKRISWLKSNNVAEYAIALFVKMMDGHSNIAPFNPSYIVQGKEVENALSFAYMKGNLLLVGPAGSGKNKFITTFSNLLDLNLIDKSCSAGVDEEGLFGYLSMKPSEDCPSPDAVNRAFKKFIEAISTKVNDNEEFASKFASADVEEQIKTIKTECADEDFSVLFAAMRSNTAQIEFEPSVLTKALEKPSMINLDEVNTLRPTVTSALHSALDNRRNILINGYKNVGIHDNVIFTATMNEGNDYAGTSIMNLAFEDRFHVIEFEAPKDIADILKLEVPTLSNKAIKVLNELYKKLKAVCGTEIQDRSFSLRAFIYAAQNIALGNGIKEGILCTIVPKIRDYEDRETVKGYVDLMLK